MAKAVPAINEPFVNSEGKITDIWYKYLLSLGFMATPSEGGSDENEIPTMGKIFTSLLPITDDDNIHLLNGDLLSYSDEKYQNFIDYIATLVEDYPDLFCTEVEYQASISTYGICGKFVYDEENQTVRLPLTIKREIVAKKEPTDDDKTWYNLYSDGYVEQGGLLDIESSGWRPARTINLLITMSNTNYSVFWTNGYTGYVDHDTAVTARGTTTFSVSQYTNYQANANWKVIGYADTSLIPDIQFQTQYDYIIINDLTNITMQKYLNATASRTIDKYVNDTSKPELDNYTDSKINEINQTATEVIQRLLASDRNIPFMKYEWDDKIRNDVSWLRCDTFSWQDGTVYEGIYNHLVDDYNNVDKSWNEATLSANLGNHYWYGLAYNGSKFVALGSEGYISTSTDGINWSVATQNANLSANLPYSEWRNLAWNGSKFVAIALGGYISTSTDGITWATVTQNANLGNHNWNNIVWNGSKFVALDSYGYISTSTDGTTWAAATLNANLGNNSWYALAYGNSKFVALGYDGYISTSTDGITWDVAAQNANLGNHNWQRISNNGVYFIALSDTGYTSFSIDGENWSEATLDENLGSVNNSGGWRALTWSGSKFVALTRYDGYFSSLSQSVDVINGIAIQYCLAADKHKIVLADQESAVLALYNTVGIAWYYILDTVNQRFKLPRTKFGFTGLRDEVGGYIEQKIPNHYHALSTMGNNQGNFVATKNSTLIDRADTTDIGVGYRYWNGSGSSGAFNADSSVFSGVIITTVAKQANSKNGYEYGVYGNSTTIQPRATQMYLYCYAGDYTHEAIEQTAGLNAELFNDKADTDLNNVDNNIDFVIDSQEPTAENNYTWYRLYKSGWVEQGGYNFLSATVQNDYFTQALLIPMADTNYQVTVNFESRSQSYHAGYNFFLLSDNYTTTTFVYCARGGDQRNYKVSSSWEVKGMADLA